MRAKATKTQSGFEGSVFSCLLLVLAVTAVATVVCNAQQKDQKLGLPRVQPSTESNSPSVIVDPHEDYRIGAGDVIEIQIDLAPELSNTFRITAAGTFVMPYLGRITAQQKTSEELSDIIAAVLRGRYLKNPKVTVTVKQINSHSFFIQGAVRRPGVYQIEGRPSLLKLITVTGGLADNHGSSAFIIREVINNADKLATNATGVATGEAGTQSQNNESLNNEEAKFEIIKTNITGLLRGRLDQNVTLQAGDIINIPATDVFFVSGEVREPGSYPLRDGTTLRQAISLAQGTTFKAAGDRAIIFREDSLSGKRQEIKANVSAVMRGASEDILIMANDIIVIPNSRFKSVGGALLNAFGVSSARMILQ